MIVGLGGTGVLVIVGETAVVGVTDAAGVLVGAVGVLLGEPVVVGAILALGVGVRVGLILALPAVGVGSGVSEGNGVAVGAVRVGVGEAEPMPPANPILYIAMPSVNIPTMATLIIAACFICILSIVWESITYEVRIMKHAT